MAKESNHKESAAKKFAKLVTEGPEEYRKKYEGKTKEQIREQVEAEMNAKMHAADTRREQRWHDRDARRNARLNEKMERWDPDDWNKPIFMRRTVGRRHSFMRVFWGVFFLVAALAVLAQIFGWLTFSINIWWVVLAVFLFAMMVAAAINLNWFALFIPAAIILTIVNYQTDLLPRMLTGQEIGGMFGVAVLLSFAFAILFHRSCHKPKCAKFDSDFSRNVGSDDGREVVIAARLGEAVRYVESKDLEKVFIDCVMGGVKVYFNGAELAGKEMTINIHGAMGGVEMYLPKNWRVVNGLNAFAGGVSEKNRTELTADSPTVRLTGNVSLGGVEIIYI